MLQAPKGLDRTTINAYEPAEGILDSTEEWRQEAIQFRWHHILDLSLQI